jgi:Mn2+/Fe2+ NRAMP family transporter
MTFNLRFDVPWIAALNAVQILVFALWVVILLRRKRRGVEPAEWFALPLVFFTVAGIALPLWLLPPFFVWLRRFLGRTEPATEIDRGVPPG